MRLHHRYIYKKKEQKVSYHHFNILLEKNRTIPYHHHYLQESNIPFHNKIDEIQSIVSEYITMVYNLRFALITY
jgi:hypothetical protein